jgi:hypothetical protein
MSISGTADPAASRVSASLETSGRTSAWVWAALGVALVTLLGSLFLSVGMGLKACPLCFYQRTFAMSLVAVLGVGVVIGAGRSGRLSLLALPLAVAGAGVALFHVWLEVSGKLECPDGLLGWGTPPKQSLALFAVLIGLLSVDALQRAEVRVGRWPGLAGSVVLGGLLALGACTSNPPFPAAPKAPYPAAPDICRPPFRP